MSFYRLLLTNHPLANIAFAVVLILGTFAYLLMPREQDPEINFNWVNITTIYPGASAEDVESFITIPLEDAAQSVSDIKFISSNSRDNVSSILIRFIEIDDRTFDKRISDLRREVQNAAGRELPPEAKTPTVIEITTSNGFPTAGLLLTWVDNDETLRSVAKLIRVDLERIDGVGRVYANGLLTPEFRIEFDPLALPHMD